MIRAALLISLLVGGLACVDETPSRRGIQTRVHIDRTEARVGDLFGVTVEIETPEGFVVESPAAPPSDEQFLTDRVEKLRSVGIPGGLRHQVLWTVRARTVGEHRLPELSVPLVWPNGRIQRLSIGSMPMPVRSVRAELPDREVYFDIEPAPPIPTYPLWPWLTATGVLGAGVTVLLLRRRRGREEDVAPTLGPSALAHETLAELDAALAEREPRALAGQLTGVLRIFVQRRWTLEGNAWTPDEIPPEVDSPVVTALRQLEAARFARTASREQVLEGGRTAQIYLADVARRG
jgi:hypothetical protein